MCQTEIFASKHNIDLKQSLEALTTTDGALSWYSEGNCTGLHRQSLALN